MPCNIRRRWAILWTAAFACFVSTSASRGEPPLPADDIRRIDQVVAEQYPSLFEFYQDIHRHPELSLHEQRTAAKLAAALKDAGYEVTAGVGGHGVVALLRNGEGPTVMVRADMDALPVKELTGLPYASTTTARDDEGNTVGVTHACGHDVHTTCLIGVARTMQQIRQRWRGTLMLIGQPAEELGLGAQQMLDAGLFTRFPKPDYALAMHVASNLSAGRVAWIEGYALASVDNVDITIRGRGGHGAMPHTTVDPILLACRTVVALQTIVSREVNPLEPVVLTVGSIHGGAKHNIIPDEVKLRLTLRSYKDEVRRQAHAAIRRICKGEAASAGAPEPEILIHEGTPSTYNQPELVHRCLPVFRQVLGEENVIPGRPQMVGEDFSRYGRAGVPSFLVAVGAVDPAKFAESLRPDAAPLPSLHSPLFAPAPEPTITTGIRILSAAVLNLMARTE